LHVIDDRRDEVIDKSNDATEQHTIKSFAYRLYQAITTVPEAAWIGDVLNNMGEDNRYFEDESFGSAVDRELKPITGYETASDFLDSFKDDDDYSADMHADDFDNRDNHPDDYGSSY